MKLSLRIFYVIFFLNLNSGLLFGQGIKGVITDPNNHPIPFATVYIYESASGTSTNMNGEYLIALKPGTYKVVYRSLGYRQAIQTIQVAKTFTTVNIKLAEAAYEIPEVTISKKTEDPGNAIMRRVIAWAPYYLNQVKHYESQVYLRGTMILDKMPKFIAKRIKASENGNEMQLKTGTVYLDESLNKITFDAPNKYQQKVISMHTTFPGDNKQPVTPIDLIKSSVYEPEIFMGQISPVSPQAFANYRFSYEGCSKEGDAVIDKIKVMPRRHSQKLFGGFLYIVEKYWCLYSVDLHNEQFWGSLDVKQTYSPVKKDVWLPVSHSFYFEGSMLGIKARYNYNSSVKYTNVKINRQLKGPSSLITKEGKSTNSGNSRDIDHLLAKRNFSGHDFRKVIREARKKERKAHRDTARSLEIKETHQNQTVKVDSTASKHDEAYWNSVRPIPLTHEEIKSIKVSDSLKLSKVTPQKKDTLAKKHKMKLPAPIKDAFFGFSKPIKAMHTNLHYSGLIALKYLKFNTVDGWDYGQSATINSHLDSLHEISIRGTGFYAFSRKILMGECSATYTYAPLKNGICSVEYYNGSMDFNGTSGLNTFLNSVQSLFFRYNDLKLYNNVHLELSNKIDIANGLRFNASVMFMQARYLVNHSYYSFFFRNQRKYSDNIPDNVYFMNPQPSNYRSSSIQAGISYTPRYFYKIEHHRKIMIRSAYPTFTLRYRAGIPNVFGSNSSFQSVAGGIHQNISNETGRSFRYSLEGGYFFNVRRIHFSEFRHFNTQPIPLQLSAFTNSFQSQDFYRYSTSKNYIEGHVQYQTDLLLLKRLPWISNRLWNENLYLNYLHTPLLKNYTELGYGLGQIYLMGEVGVFATFENLKFRTVSVKFNLKFH